MASRNICRFYTCRHCHQRKWPQSCSSQLLVLVLSIDLKVFEGMRFGTLRKLSLWSKYVGDTVTKYTHCFPPRPHTALILHERLQVPVSATLSRRSTQIAP